MLSLFACCFYFLRSVLLLACTLFLVVRSIFVFLCFRLRVVFLVFWLARFSLMFFFVLLVAFCLFLFFFLFFLRLLSGRGERGCKNGVFSLVFRVARFFLMFFFVLLVAFWATKPKKCKNTTQSTPKNNEKSTKTTNTPDFFCRCSVFPLVFLGFFPRGGVTFPQVLLESPHKVHLNFPEVLLGYPLGFGSSCLLVGFGFFPCFSCSCSDFFSGGGGS